MGDVKKLCENVYQQLSKIILVSKIYIFSGLGVDKRVFDNIDFGTKSPEFIDWISPLKNESLAEYSKRISENMKSEKPILIGPSFGGIVATEISKIRTAF